MKKYRAYTQTEYGAEKFDIYNGDGTIAEVEAESTEESEELFKDYIYDTSLYSYEETEKWIEENPIYVYEV